MPTIKNGIDFFKKAPLIKRNEPLKVLFVATEAAPYIAVGGLGQVMFSLPKALKEMGVDARIFIPKYGSLDEGKYPLSKVFFKLKVPTGAEEEKQPQFLICNVKQHIPSQNALTKVPIYFLENREYYEKRANVYGYSDDPLRFVLLCRGVLEFLKQSDWVPDIIHCNDWHTGALINFLKTIYKQDPKLSKIVTVFSIHNLYHQGIFDHRFISEADFDDGKSSVASLFSEKLTKQNFMKRGIIYSDAVITVSETYAQEILTKDYGEGLDELLREQRTKIFGILNGLDYDELNPKNDKNLVANYDVSSLSKRKENKIHLQKEFNLEVSEKIPIIGMVSRLDEQKGLDLLFPIIELLITEFGIEFVIVGGGEPKYRSFFEDVAKKHPKKLGAHLIYDLVLPKHIFSGSDIILVPSKFEPCGITQMEGMRYGAIPIVRKTGGLADTVKDFNPETKTGNGFVFEKFSSYSLLGAIVRALENFKYKRVWKELIKEAMSEDFSWKVSAKKYFNLYQKLLQK